MFNEHRAINLALKTYPRKHRTGYRPTLKFYFIVGILLGVLIVSMAMWAAGYTAVGDKVREGVGGRTGQVRDKADSQTVNALGRLLVTSPYWQAVFSEEGGEGDK